MDDVVRAEGTTEEVEASEPEEDWVPPAEPSDDPVTQEPAEPDAGGLEGDDDVDERGVSYKNVAAEWRRKFGELEATLKTKDEVYKEVLSNIPTYAGEPVKTDKEPAKPKSLLEDKDLAAVEAKLKGGDTVGAIADIVGAIIEGRSKVDSDKEVAAQAPSLRDQLLEKHPELADKTSDLYKATVKAAETLKKEWASIGLNVDPSELERTGKTIYLEKQAVDRALSENPSLRGGEPVAKKKKEIIPVEGQGVVASAGGKPPVAKKTTTDDTKVDVPAEVLRMREEAGLPNTPEALKKWKAKQGDYNETYGGGKS